MPSLQNSTYRVYLSFLAFRENIFGIRKRLTYNWVSPNWSNILFCLVKYKKIALEIARDLVYSPHFLFYNSWSNIRQSAWLFIRQRRRFPLSLLLLRDNWYRHGQRTGWRVRPPSMTPVSMTFSFFPGNEVSLFSLFPLSFWFHDFYCEFVLLLRTNVC